MKKEYTEYWCDMCNRRISEQERYTYKAKSSHYSKLVSTSVTRHPYDELDLDLCETCYNKFMQTINEMVKPKK